MLKLHEIEQIQIELTTRCNARCPMCMRNYRGMDYNSGYPETELTLADIKKILPPEKVNGLKISFNGNLGDFGLAKDGYEIVEYLLKSGATQIYINTNGSMRTPEWWALFADPRVSVGFALDGLADTHSLYRQDTDWHKIIKNATAYIRAGGIAIWRWIPFDHNRHQEQACRDLAKELRFSQFENIDEGRNRGPVYSRNGEFSHNLGEPWSDTPPPSTAMLESHITWFSPKTVKLDKDTNPVNIVCNHKRQRDIYIAADGSVYPCCYLGFYPATMIHPGNEQILPLVKENNALEYPLEHCIAWFDSVEETWAKNSIAEGRLYTCVNSCAR